MAKKVPNITKVINSNGAVRYKARAKIGRQDIQKTFLTREAAIEWKEGVEAAKKTAKVKNFDLHATTFNEIYDFAESLSLDEYSAGCRKCLPRLRSMMGTATIQSLTQATLSNFVKSVSTLKFEKKKGVVSVVKAGTARKYFFAFKLAVTAWARHYSYTLGLDWNYKLPSGWSEPREVRISDEDIAKLIAATDTLYEHKDDWKDAIYFFLNTALRNQELFYAKWSDIYDKALLVRAENSKTNTQRYVPLNLTCREILERRAEKYGKEGRIFGNFPSIEAFNQQYYKYLRKNAGLMHINKHDFRHEAICRMIEKAATPHEQIMKMTGHTDMKTYLRYFNMRPDNVPASLTEITLT